MANFFGEVQVQLGSIWKRLSAGQKAILILVSLALAVGVSGVVYWSSRLEMGLLFGGLTQEDAGAVQAQLEEEGVPYELTSGGTTILVPKERVYELRNRLVQKGLPKGDGQGMEIFDDLQIGMTEFLQNVNLTRAMEGELARTISWLQPVAAAKVHVTRPKQTVFSELERAPTAAVILKLVPGRTLGQQEVMGIAHIVAAAVEGLDAENVRIVDEKGRLLSKGPEELEDQLASGQLEIKRSFETTMTRKVQDHLDEVIGVNKVRVMCNVDLDFQHEVRRVKEYSYPAEGKVIRTEKTNLSDSTMPKAGGGPTSAESKLADSSGGPVPAEKSSTEDSEREFAVNETDMDITQGGAKVERLSLAIMIDKSLEERSDDIEGIVKQAVGFDESRGDTFTTAVIEFSVPEVVDDTEELGSYEQQEFIVTMVKHGVQGLSVAGVILALFFILKRSEKKVKTARERHDEAALAPGDPAGEARRIRHEVKSAVEADPVMATDILQEWLKEESP